MKNPYPKIETLFKRDKNTFKVTDQIRCPEFENIKLWRITEKIHGTNIRVLWERSKPLEFRGKTDKAQIPTFLLEKLEEMFSADRVQNAFTRENELPERMTQSACLYGEGYGARIQKGGGNYRDGVSFRLIDVRVNNWWFEWDSVVDIASKLSIKTVPTYGIMGIEQAITYIGDLSLVAQQEKEVDVIAEGIVARSHPLVLFRNGNPVVWKLKQTDY